VAAALPFLPAGDAVLLNPSQQAALPYVGIVVTCFKSTEPGLQDPHCIEVGGA
jgi:hypothetical protein